MIRLEGDRLPLESRGAVPPILFGDVLRDVPGIPLQIGWVAALANNCGVDDNDLSLRLGGADLSELIYAVPSAGVVQLENEWIYYSAILSGPVRLAIAQRGYRETDPAAHAKGTAVYFVETRPIYCFAYVPPGCSYPPDALVQLRVNDNADTPPATVRLQDDRLIPGVRLVTVEFDASHAFYAPPPPRLPSHLVAIFPQREPTAPQVFRTGGGGAGHVAGFQGVVTGRSNPAGARDPRMRLLLPPPPTLARAPAAPTAPFAEPVGRRISLRQGVGTVTADFKGLRDTSAGRYSGTALASLQQPAAIVRLLLEETYGETDPARYHEPTWTATRTRHTQRGITWRLVWQGEPFESFRAAAQLCGQADLYLDDEGRWRYGFRDPLTPAVGTLTARELLEDPALAWTAGRDVVTELEVAWGAGLQSGTITLESPVMRNRHGTNHGGVAFPWAATETIARQLGQYQLSRRDRPRQNVTVRAAHVTLPLTLTDKVYVETPLLNLYGTHRVPFEIIGITDRGDQRALVLLEGDPLNLELQLSGTLALAGGATLSKTLSGTLDTGGALAAVLALAGTLTIPRSLSRTVAGTLLTGHSITRTLTGTLEGAGTFPTLGHVTTVGDTGTSTDTVQSYTTAAGETYMLVCIGIKGGSMSSVQAVTFGATSLTSLKDQLDTNSSLRGTLYGGVVSAGTTANVTVDYLGGNANAVIAIRTYVGVVSAGTAVAAVTASASSLAVTLSSVTNARCVDFLLTAGGDATPTIGAGQATEFTRTNDGASIVFIDGSFANAVTSLQWTGLTHGNDDAILIAIPLLGA